MTTGVHHRYVMPVRVGLPHPAGVRQTGPLLDRQGIHVRPQQHGGPGAIAQQPDHAGAADALGHLESEIPQVPADDPGGADLLEGQLRMGVQILVQRHQLTDGSHARPPRMQ
jgi:hypothetical protein